MRRTPTSARRILEHVGLRRYAGPLVLEPASLQVDGEGTCIAAIGSVIDRSRNPGLTAGRGRVRN